MAYAPTVERPHPMGGEQRLYRFENGYGASVVRFAYSYGGSQGLWELGVIAWEGDSGRWSLTYDTPITDDVEGYLTEAAVEGLLGQIETLPKEAA